MSNPQAKASRKTSREGHTELAGPEFVRFFGPLLDALRELGDSGRPKEATARVAQNLRISDEKLDETLKSGASRFQNQIYWAKFYLAKAGYIGSSQRGVWTLTDKARGVKLDSNGALAVFQKVQSGFTDGTNEIPPDDTSAPVDDLTATGDAPAEIPRFSDDLASTLRRLSAGGFEKLCKLILRSVGFEEVEVTGRSGDGGIDGVGTLRVNRLITDRIAFQCKRYSSPVSPSYIRDFRGAMQGRADRGIFLSTGTFSAEARREASREGASRIELVDISFLIELLTDLQLGVVKQTIHVVDHAFFAEYGFDPEKTENSKSRG